jgi:ATP-dependent Clp protease adaptor protein ClpS
MSDTKVIAIEDIGTITGKPCNVILYNDEEHSMDQVISQIIKATKCSVGQASNIMFEAHKTGRAVCFSGHKERCELVCMVLEQLQLRCDIEE